MLIGSFIKALNIPPIFLWAEDPIREKTDHTKYVCFIIVI